MQTKIWQNTSSSPDQWNWKKSQQQATEPTGPTDMSGVWTFCNCALCHVVKARGPVSCASWFITVLICLRTSREEKQKRVLWIIQSFFLEGLFPICPLKIKTWFKSPSHLALVPQLMGLSSWAFYWITLSYHSIFEAQTEKASGACLPIF